MRSVGGRYAKTAFVLDWEQEVIQCPQAVRVPFRLGSVVHFPPAVCAACPVQARCTTSPRGRSVSIQPDERLLVELRERQQAAQGHAALRERVAVVQNLHVIARLPTAV